MIKAAFVVQRCGMEVNGGAEAHALQLALRMQKYWNIDILTTCALDYITWADHYLEGDETIEGVKIKRFPVDRKRNIRKFNKYSSVVLNNSERASIEQEVEWIALQGPLCSKLEHYILSNRDTYRFFLFFTYLYWTTFNNLPHVMDKAWLVPTVHDEPPVYLSLWNDFFTLPRGFFFNTIEEYEFLKKRFPTAPLNGKIAGVGVEVPAETDAERFKTKFNIHAPYILYVGRLDYSKGVKELFDFFTEYKKRVNSELKLVLVGKGRVKIPSCDDIIRTGFVDEQDKFDAISGCKYLVNPSPYESLSMVLLEAWILSRPVIVTDKCSVLKGQCKRSNGGLWYSNYNEFEYILDNISAEEREAMGRNGHTFSVTHYTWETIEQKYMDVFDS